MSLMEEDVVHVENVQAPVWLQNHEHRLTKNEKDIEKVFSDVSRLSGENSELRQDIREVKDILNNSNREQLEILNEMNAQMRDEFFKKKSTSQSERWKLLGIIVGGIVGGGGALVAIVATVVQYVGG